MKADGADVVKLFATASIRDGGKQTMSDEQVQAACGEATAVGLRSVVHAHNSSGARASVLAGCTSIEHGTFIDDPTLKLMVEHGTYFDPNFLVLHNYLDNKPKFLGIGNYTDEGFAYMEKGLPLVADVTKRAYQAAREDGSRHGWRGRIAWTQRRRIYLPRKRWRDRADGRHCEWNRYGGGSAAASRQARVHQRRTAGRYRGRARQSGSGHHGGSQCCVRHEGRKSLPE